MRLIPSVVFAALFVAASAATSGAQSVDEIVDKSLAASGGRAALEKITSRSTVGTLTVSTPGGDFPGTIELLNQAPNKSRSLVTIDLSAAGAGTATVEQRFDGTDGYALDSMRGNAPMPAGQVQNQRNNIFPSGFLGYKERGTKIALAGKEKVADHDVYVLTVTPAAGPASRLYLDAQSYLPVRGVVTVELPEVGAVEQTVNFSDYREVDGVKVPFHLTVSSPVQSFTVVVTKVEHNVKIDPALFAKPSDK